MVLPILLLLLIFMAFFVEIKPGEIPIECQIPPSFEASVAIIDDNLPPVLGFLLQWFSFVKVCGMWKLEIIL